MAREKTQIDPRSVLVAAVAEPREPWASEIVRLFVSLRSLGGGITKARGRAYFVGEVDPETARSLVALDVQVVTIPPIDARWPHANKVAMLGDIDDAEWLLAFDTDTAVAGDLAPLLVGSAARARVVDDDPLSRREWRSLFEAVRLKAPPRKTRTTATGRRTGGYFNSGALFVPRVAAQPLALAWRKYLDVLPSVYDRLPAIAAHSFYTDQFALALGIVDADIEILPLGQDVNTPTHTHIHRRWDPVSIRPKLIHYHHNTGTDGRIAHSGYPGIDAAIDAVNEAMATRRHLV